MPVRQRPSPLLVLAVACLAVACRRPPAPAESPPEAPPPLPQVSGEIAVPGLQGPVTVVRDRWGVPHIRAGSADDLFFAQGFVQAQDRLFQMDLWRRSAQGRLAEVLGANFIERDAMTRRIQFRGNLDDEWASYGPDARAIATAFTRGINAWIARTRDSLPEEFALAGWTPEAWTPEDLLERTDAFVASAGAAEELLRARLAAAVGPPAAFRLLPPDAQAPRPAAPPAAGAVDLSAINYFVGDVLRRVGTPPFFSGLNAPVPGALRHDVPSPAPPPPFIVRTPADAAVALGPGRSATGAAIVAASLSVPLETPGVRYLVHLDAPGWHVAGVTAPWRPGVAFGHNDRVAWAAARLRLDTQDIVVERVNPANERQVAAPGGWQPMTIVSESVAVKGRASPFVYERQYTAHGVVVALDRERHLAYTLRWSGAEPGGAAELGALALDRAGSVAAFRGALGRWKMPTASFVVADVDGHIAGQTAGLVPARAPGRGDLPATASEAGGARGFVPFERLARSDDPGDAIVTAWLGGPYLRERAAAGASPGAAARDVERLVTVLRDSGSPHARALVPLLAPLSAAGEVETARRRLLAWNGEYAPGSGEAALYTAWEDALGRALAAGRVPADLRDEFLRRGGPWLVDALTAPSSVWFDGEPVAARDRLLLASLGTAVDDVSRWPRAGAAPAWADAQTVAFRHPLGISTRAARRYNVGPFALPGGRDSILGVARASAERTIASAVQLVFDVSDWDRSRVAVPPGQAAAPDSPHHADQVQPWLEGLAPPLVYSAGAIRDAAESTLTLVPR